MAKYDPLHDHLKRSAQPRLTMSFIEIEDLVGSLPQTAMSRDEWWSNEDPHTTRHVQSKAWTLAGYRAEVDRRGKSVTFFRR